MANQEQVNPQIALWDQQHASRYQNGPEGMHLRDVPTPTALHLLSLLRPSSRILEVESGNGRDARTWAIHGGHTVDCIDFSSVALEQLRELSEAQQISQLINGHIHDVSCGTLPKTLPSKAVYDAFYARSALTIGDEALLRLMKEITQKMLSGGVILIEGRGLGDPKIMRSMICGNMADDNGHLRRVYTIENMTQLATQCGWEIETITTHIEEGFVSPLHMLRFVAHCK